MDIKTAEACRRAACNNIDKVFEKYSDKLENSPADLLADLRLWCDRVGLDFEKALVESLKFYEREKDATKSRPDDRDPQRDQGGS